MFRFSIVPHYERCHLHLTLLNSHYECMTGIIQSQWDCVSIELIQIARYVFIQFEVMSLLSSQPGSEHLVFELLIIIMNINLNVLNGYGFEFN